MTIRSMTGYGSAVSDANESTVTVEFRTVNHRFLDLHVRLPREYGFLENEIQQTVRGRLSRGRVDINIGILSGRAGEMEFDPEVARSYFEAARQLGAEFQLEERMDLKTLVGLPGVLRPRNPAESTMEDGALASLVLEGVRGALDGVVQMREREGEVLRGELIGRLEAISERVADVRSLAPTLAEEYRTKLEQRLSRLMPQNGVDPGRLEQEVAVFADRADVSEEVTRLESHLQQFSEWLSAGGEIGKKLDFLLQEMHREISTILAKTENVEITRTGIEVKAEIEKLREQVQNIE